MGRIREDHYKWIWAAVFLIAAVLSFTLLHDIYLHNGFTDYAIHYLDDKANTVLALVGASTSASVAITMMPSDIGNPVATELANISSYSIIVLAAVHLEKYLITLASLLGLKFLMPLSLGAAAVNTAFYRNPSLTRIIKRVMVFALSVILVVPASVYVSNLIEQTYQEDIQISIEQTQKEADEIKENIGTEDSNLWDQFISTISGGAVELVSHFENSLNNFVEAISVMLITACVIPLLTFAVLLWLIKSVFQIDLKTPSLSEMAGHVKVDPYRITGRKHDTKQIE